MKRPCYSTKETELVSPKPPSTQRCWSGIRRNPPITQEWHGCVIHIMLKFLRWVCFKHANRGLLSFPPGFWAPFASHQFVNRGMIIIDHPPKNGLFFFGKVVRSRETPFFSPYVVHIPIHPGWSLKQDQLLPVPLHLLPSGSGGREAADCGDRRRCGSQCEFLAGWGTSGTRFQRLEWIQDAVIYFQMFQDSTKWALKLKLNHHV